MDLDTARVEARALLGEVEPAGATHGLIELGRREAESGDFFAQLDAMTPEGFPLPDLLLIGLTMLLGLENYGPGDKMRWGVRFAYRGQVFGVEYRKFGLRVLVEERNLDSPLIRQVLGKARALTNVAERFLRESLVPAQIASGNFTVRNLYAELDFRYRFLRAQAEAAYRRPPPPPKHGASDFGLWTYSQPGRPLAEGSALGTATVDAFFSRLEHLFILATAFQPAGLPEGGMLTFLGTSWSSKLQHFLDLDDAKAKRFYDRLLEVRVEWRNPMAHGGLMSRGASLYFHVPGVGALPALLRRTPEGVRLGLTLSQVSFESICELFDEFDAFLGEGPLRHAYQWADAGLDVAFDVQNRERLLDVIARNKFDDYLEYAVREDDRHSNMDY